MIDTDQRPINVMLLVGSLERGGAERQVVALANGLDPVRSRVHVCSLSRENPLAGDLCAPERFHVMEKRWKYDVTLVTRLARLFRQLHIDVVHCFLFKAEMVGRLAGRLAGTPAVIASNRCPHFLHPKLMLWAARATSKYFDVMVANSWAGRDFEVTRQGIDPTKVVVIPNGVDTNRFRPMDGARKRLELGIDRDAKVVGMFAHFRGNKNHAMFLKAAARVSQSCPEAVFVCVGAADGATGRTLYAGARHLVEERRIDDRVLFLGERQDVDELYNACDIKVLASFYEGTANVLLEAMACGLPIIATDVGDNARVIVDGETGFVVAVDDLDALTGYLTRLLTDSALREHMGCAARARVEQEFSIPAMVSRTSALYFNVLRSKGSLRGEPSVVSIPE
jgi:glycosyltransferase involved in cell wall biosynthesis